MPVAERPSQPVRGQKTICLPCSQQQYEQAVDDPERFRTLLDPQIEATPELFPPEIRRGYHMKDLYTSRKTGWTLRRIELRNLQCYLVRPSFLMPYFSGHTEDVQAPLFPQVRRPVLGLDRGLRPLADVLTPSGVLAGPGQPGRDDGPGPRPSAPPSRRRREAHDVGRPEGLPGGHRRRRVLPGPGRGPDRRE